MSLKRLLLLAGLAALAACSASGPTDPLCLTNPEPALINCWPVEVVDEPLIS